MLYGKHTGRNIGIPRDITIAPAEAWAKLIKCWPTEAYQEESVDMANRRPRVQTNSKTWRNLLVERMDGAVCHTSISVLHIMLFL